MSKHTCPSTHVHSAQHVDAHVSKHTHVQARMSTAHTCPSGHVQAHTCPTHTCPIAHMSKRPRVQAHMCKRAACPSAHMSKRRHVQAHTWPSAYTSMHTCPSTHVQVCMDTARSVLTH